MPPNNKKENIEDSNEEDNSIKMGRFLANPKEGDEVVITGIAGKFPDSDDVHHFRDNLFNKVDLVSGDNRRWEPGHPEIPQRTGKINNIKKFDAGFFGVHYRQANCMDAMARQLLEKVTEAIFDAGMHPSDFAGTKTGLFVGVCFSENEKNWFYDKLIPQGFSITGCARSMISNRLSYFLKLEGPSVVIDTACSSSLYGFEHAYKAIRMGQCEQAIVCGSNLCLHPFVSLQFARLGVLSMDGVCKVFDNAGNGYVRSEAISAIILQKAKDANRIYAKVMHAKTNCDGYKDSGITYPSGEMQVRLLREFYKECETVKASELSFLEAHGTGTKVGDPEELQAIEEVFLEDRKVPLLLGSLKSNIGHSEPASGLCSITKVIIAFETGYIPPNINYSTPRAGVKPLEDGRLKVVVEKTRFQDDRGLIAINSFGFGGGNAHVLLKHHIKEKGHSGKAKDNLPRLVCVSGRNTEAIKCLLDDVVENGCDIEHIRLLHNIFRKNISGHVYRGFSLISKQREISRSSYYYGDSKLPIVLAFGKLNNLSQEKASEFLESAIYSGTIHRISEILLTKNISITDILTKGANTILQEVLLNVSTQIAFWHILKELEIVPEKIFGASSGLSLGTLMCAYADEAITLSELLECALAIANAATLATQNNNVNAEELESIMTKSSKIANQLIKDITKILEKPRRLTSKVIFDCNPSEISSSYIVSSFGKKNIVKEVIEFERSRRTKFVFYEIGNGDLVDSLKGHLRYKDPKLLVSTNGSLKEFLISLGRLYEFGHNPKLHKLYPKVDFPVSRSTPMISPKIKWNHKRDWYVTHYKAQESLAIEEKIVLVMLKDPAYTFIGGHVIDGRILFPATGYLQFAWETLAQVHGLMISDMEVVFENCKFKRACSVPKDGSKLELTIMVQRGSGNFEVIEGGVTVVSGIISKDSNETLSKIPIPNIENTKHETFLNSKDIYKELRLRGYNYSGKFQSLEQCNIDCDIAKIKWDGNWITFIDNMLQMKILQEDTRLLYVPTKIESLYIDAKKHLMYAYQHGENPMLPVYVDRYTGIIRSGGIEIKGLKASAISRRKYLGTPVLEKYVFVPNCAKLKLEQAVRVNLQILLENIFSIKVKVVELIDEETSGASIGEIIHDVLADQPLIQPDITVLSKNPLEIKSVKVEDGKLLTQTDCSLVVASKILQRTNIFQQASGCIKDVGFVMSREPLDFDVSKFKNKGIHIVTVFSTDTENLVYFRKTTEYKKPSLVNVTNQNDFSEWLQHLQKAIKKEEGNVLVYSENQPLNGILGLVNCIRREPGGQPIQCAFMVDGAPQFDPNNSFYFDQLKKNLAVNVFRNNQWGTYRHLLMENSETVKSEHCYLNSTVKGDLSSLKWVEGPFTTNCRMEPEDLMISVYYTALNFRDVMTASGRIQADVISRDRRLQECVQGFEVSGRTPDGKRVMSVFSQGAMSTILKGDKYLTWEIPDSWSMEEAATVPVVYSTCLFALECGKISRGQTILIHSGTGGIGQAAINIALHLGCTVFTTVGTQEKREFLKNKFPQLTDKNIHNSRDISFEMAIKKITNGRGVDIVLNSLAEEKLIASVRCLAKGGRFLEIGKFDLANDNEISLLLFQKQASFHGVMLDQLFHESPTVKLRCYKWLQDGLDAGYVKPLNRTVFKMEEAEQAFRFMSSGKHTGKVLLQIRKEENEKILPPKLELYEGFPRYYCNEDYTYIICGGLGGFGLELADWLTLRGCRKLVLTSRNGVKTGYQAYRINIWKSYGCSVEVSTADITTLEGCTNLIKEANTLGPVHAIFNLAVVLRDAILENQSEESFDVSFGPKARATEYLDKVTRDLCPLLRDFVIFSSVSCGRGNPGQSNYGMANSIMERICEKRRDEGLPALAIEWGAVGEVGLVAEMQSENFEMEIGGTLQQRISSCLQVMDDLLRRDEAAIVSSMVVAEKKAGAGGADNIVDAVANILGIKDLKSISIQATLAEVGMDSMTAVEIKQTLEREFEVFLTAQDIKSMTFSRLIEIQDERSNNKTTDGTPKERPLAGMEMILRLMGDVDTANIPVLPIQGKPTDRADKPTLIIFPGIEGTITVLEPTYANIEAELVGLQFCNDTQADTIVGMANAVLPYVEEKISKKTSFFMFSYSFGTVVALETLHILESKGYVGHLIIVDGSPDYLKNLTKVLEVESDDKLQTSLVIHFMSMYISFDIINKHIVDLFKCNTYDERIRLAQNIVNSNTTSPYSPEYQRDCAWSVYKRLRALVDYEPNFKLKSMITLIKPTHTSIELSEHDYGLSKICEQPVDVKVFSGNHVTVLDNPDVASAINEIIHKVPEVKKRNQSVKKGKAEATTNAKKVPNGVPSK